MKSQTNNKQRDRVASYASGGMTNRVNHGGPSSQVNQKKKSYRARGCRGGASRKGRMKQELSNHSRQDDNEENDPSRLNNNSEEQSFKRAAPKDGSQPRKVADASNKRELKRTYEVLSENKSTNAEDVSPGKMRTLSILPNGTEMDANAFGGEGTHSDPSTGMNDEQHDGAAVVSNGNKSEVKPILPGTLQEKPAHSTTRSALSAIARPTSSAAKSDAREGGYSGFSFFCVSPRSFLSGQKKSKSQRLY